MHFWNTINKINLRCKLKGSYTVEISLLIPIILIIIYLMLYLSIYIHDRAVIDYVIIDSQVGDEDKTQEEIIDTIEKKTIGKWNIKVCIDNNQDSRCVSVEGKMSSFLKDLNYISSERFYNNDEVLWIRK